MDRRSLLFMILLCSSFLLVNSYLEKQKFKDIEEQRRVEMLKATEEEQVLAVQIQERTAFPFDLPIVSLYSDEESGSLELTEALQCNSCFIVPSTEIEKPLFAKIDSKDGSKHFVPLDKIVGTLSERHGFSLYTIHGTKRVKLPKFSENEELDVQFVTPKNSLSEENSVFLGSLRNGEYSLLSKHPKENAIGLIRYSDQYFPVVMYDASIQEFYPLVDLLKGAQGITISAESIDIQTRSPKEEHLYVLENEYMQLVFSNKGAALSEINLPLDKRSPKSLVREIEFDRKIQSKLGNHASFPLREAYRHGNLDHTSASDQGGYYPLLRRDFFDVAKGEFKPVAKENLALNIVSDYPEQAELIYHVKSFTHEKIVFEAMQQQRRITKTFTLLPESQEAPYCFHVDIQVSGDNRNLWLTTGVPEVEWISNAFNPVLKYRATFGKKNEVKKLDIPENEIVVNSVKPDWLCNSNGFFGIILDPLTDLHNGYKVDKISGSAIPSRLCILKNQYAQYSEDKLPGYNMFLPLRSQENTISFRVYAGPMAEKPLLEADNRFSASKENHAYIRCQEYHGWFAFLTQPIAKGLFLLMKGFYAITHSWAFSIILLTVALRAALYPLNAWSIRSMHRMKMIAPKVKAIQERNKKNPQQSQIEIMQLYRKEKVNPIGGCFPILIQMPFLFGMFDLLKSSFELRGAPFISGWISDLTAPDVLFNWSQPLYFIGNEFHLLPIILGIAMWFQQRMTLGSTDKGQMTEQQRQQVVISNVMSIVFTFMFYHFPSGLNIYWLSSMLLGAGQQWWIKRKLENI